MQLRNLISQYRITPMVLLDFITKQALLEISDKPLSTDNKRIAIIEYIADSTYYDPSFNRVTLNFKQLLEQASQESVDDAPLKPNDDCPGTLDITYCIVDSEGGEGMGSQYTNVLKISLANTTAPVYISMIGAYDSYNGTDWEWATVKYSAPAQVLVTEYQDDRLF